MCDVCSIINKERETIIVYEDEKTIVFLPEFPKVEGHLIVASKEHYPTIESVPHEVISHFFYVSSFAATVLFEGLGAQGTNIIMNDGSASDIAHFTIDVIPRKENDDIDLKFEAKKLPEEDMKDAQEKIGWEFVPPGQQQPQQPVVQGQALSQAPVPQEEHIKKVDQADLDKNLNDEEKRKKEHMINFFNRIP